MTNNNTQEDTTNTMLASSLIARFDTVAIEEIAIIKKQARGMIQDYLSKAWYIHRGNLVIDGHFDNNVALIVDGNLTVRGLYNDYKSGSGYLLCLGDFRAQNIMSWNAFAVTGSLYAAGFVWAYYNDFPFEVFGETFQARGMAFFDKAYALPERQLVEAGSHNGESFGNLETVFSQDLHQYHDSDLEEISLVEALALLQNEDQDALTVISDLDEMREKFSNEATDFLYLNLNSDWDVVLKNIYNGRIFRQPYAFPDDPNEASVDTLCLSLMQQNIPQAIYKAALSHPTLWYDLALAPETPPEVLAQLAKHDAWWIREAVVGQANTPGNTLMTLAADKDKRVRAALVHNPQATLTLIDQLIDDPDPEVRRAIAASTSAPSYFDHLLEDEDQIVRRILAAHPALPLAHRRKLITDSAVEMRRHALQYLPPTPELVEEFAVSEDPELRAWAAQMINKVASKSDDDETIFKNVLQKDEVLSLLLSPDDQVRQSAFQQQIWISSLPLDLLGQYFERFAQDELQIVRFRVAQICRDGDILARLAQDSSQDVRLAVATNFATPSSVLTEMVKTLAETQTTHVGFGASPSQSFVMMLLENPLLPAEAFPHIRRIIPLEYRLARHGNLPLEIYLAYERYDDPYGPGDQEYEDIETMQRLSSQPNQALAFMAKSSHWGFRHLAAMHANTPAAALHHLLTTSLDDRYLLSGLAANKYLGSGSAEAETMITTLLSQNDHEIDRTLLGNPYLPKDILLREGHRSPDEAQKVLWQCYGIEWQP